MNNERYETDRWYRLGYQLGYYGWKALFWVLVGLGLLALCVMVYGILMALSTQGPVPSP